MVIDLLDTRPCICIFFLMLNRYEFFLKPSSPAFTLLLLFICPSIELLEVEDTKIYISCIIQIKSHDVFDYIVKDIDALWE
jgi:hypothetical protein